MMMLGGGRSVCESGEKKSYFRALRARRMRNRPLPAPLEIL